MIQIQHRWVNLSGLDKGLIKYYDFYRALVGLFPIDILRNPIDSNAGIWVVGNLEDVEEVTKGIIKVVTKVGKSSKRKLRKILNEHGHSTKANYKSRVMQKIVDIAIAELIAINEEIAQEPEYVWEMQKLKEIRKQYIKETPSLKILKPFKCRI